MNISHIRILSMIFLLFSCDQKKPASPEMKNNNPLPGTFAYDVAFMKSHKKILVLGAKTSLSKVLVVGDYQGRVMTSTAGGDEGNSYGWINYDLIRSGENKAHMNPYGGEDRFWLGPEGGPFALYFKKGDPFDFEHWQTPSLIDTEPFEFVSADSLLARYRKSASIDNYSGTVFKMDIERQIQLLEPAEIEKEFDISLENLKAVSFRSTNSITNAGPDTWSKEKGLLSIWILGMFNPSPGTVILLPHELDTEPSSVTDNYFGDIPSERIRKMDHLLLLKGDGKFRSKVGIAPGTAKNIVGSYNADKHMLTLVKFDLLKSGDYVNSKWEKQKEPFRGDAVNAYNDGPQADGSQLGPFYELESSSPARELKKGETLTHRHTTLHLEGGEVELSLVVAKILGIKLTDIPAGFSH
jgi:hypothetical protein